jgi:type II pantothenate kinase
MAKLCRLADPERYIVSTWNLADAPETLRYWLDLFGSFPGRFRRLLAQDALAGRDFERRWSDFREAYAAGMRDIEDRARRTQRLHTIELCRFRQRMLKSFGFEDPYRGVKSRENDLAAGLYSQEVAQIDAAGPSERWPRLLRALLAGNMFDLGSPETIERYHAGELNFLDNCKETPVRPWFADDADVLIARLTEGPQWRRALFFVDNAGADIALGVIPWAREMARTGIHVTLAANREPALNDITVSELRVLLDRLGQIDPCLSALRQAGALDTVDSGGDTPLIDLSRVSDACNEVAAASDLIVLEGMGRGVESNWTQEFTCDAWRIALLKDRTVARWLGAEVFDAVCRLDEVERSGGHGVVTG